MIRLKKLSLLVAMSLGSAVHATDLTHATGFEELRASMRRVDALLSDRRMTQLDIDRALLRQAETIAAQAGALAANAKTLAAGIDSETDEAERATIADYADRLASAAEDLRAQAAGGHLNRLNFRIDRLRVACANCHERFRQPAR